MSEQYFTKSVFTEILILFSFLTAVFSCHFADEEKTASYLHISHTRLYEKGKTIDPEAEKIDFGLFDMVWIGGDLMGHSTEDSATINYLNGVFNFSDPNVLWAPGNHDYDYHPEWIQPLTKRQTFYTTHKNGLTILVLDTQKDLSKMTGPQLDLINQVTDTIAVSSHLIVLTHKMIWFYGNEVLSPAADSIPNAGFCETCVYGINPNNYYTDVYPKLLKVKNKGIEVINIAGDIGAKVSEFEYKDENGIHFLASGIRSGQPGNKMLVFEHDLLQKKLTWKYVPVTKSF